MKRDLFGPKPPGAVRAVTFVVRSNRAETAGFLNDGRQAVRSVNGSLPVASVRTVQLLLVDVVFVAQVLVRRHIQAAVTNRAQSSFSNFGNIRQTRASKASTGDTATFHTTSTAVSLCTSILCTSIALGQQPNPKLTFEVASIKAAAPQAMARLQGGVDGGPGTPDPGRMRFTDMPLRTLIMRAYGVQSFQVAGPSWMDNQRFDVIAKVPGGATKEDAQIMLQNLLADRFKLKLHKGSKEAPIYELVVAKGGIKMKEAAQAAAAPAEGAGGPPPGPPSRGKDGLLKTPHRQLGIQATVNGRMRMQGDAATMARLTEILAIVLGRPVVDKTGLTGAYDVTLDFSPEGMGPGPKGPAPGEGPGNPAEAPPNSNDSGPTIFTALQAQLGLKLESRKRSVDLLVVDSVEKAPTKN
jgi:uncharacterized protein (TIGR03435 family)